jgi:hypothetical protein
VRKPGSQAPRRKQSLYFLGRGIPTPQAWPPSSRETAFGFGAAIASGPACLPACFWEEPEVCTPEGSQPTHPGLEAMCVWLSVFLELLRGLTEGCCADWC